MMKSLTPLLLGVCLLPLTATVHAAGNAEAGAGKAATCAACHAADGNSTIAENPVLAGQVPGYIAAQLAAFKSGSRANPVMAGMAAPLSDEDMADLDAFYASQSTHPRGVSEDQAEQAQSVEKLYRGGAPELHIAACMACHGPSGKGIPPTYPKLAGQHPEYLESQLLAYKNGERSNEIMNSIAFKLSLEEIKALSLYMSALK